MIEPFQSLFAPPRQLILVLAAFWIGLALAETRTERHNISKESLNSLVLLSLISYLAGGRLIYALVHLPAFVESPSDLISLNLDLFHQSGGLLTAIVVGWIYVLRHNLPIHSALDALTPFFATLAVGIALSHLAAGTAFGRATDAPWGIELWGAVRHPSQIYELIASLLIFCFVWFRERLSPPGRLFLMFSASTAAVRLWLEGFRGDSMLVMGGLRLTQLIAWIVLAAALFVSEWLLQRARESNP